MVERSVPVFGRLVLDRDAIVRAALRAYVESWFAFLPNRPGMTSMDLAWWTGDLQRGAIFNADDATSNEVVAWTEAGVVGLAFDTFGPIEQLGLAVEAVTGGPEDVRGAVPGLPEELEPAFVMAAGMLDVGPDHGQKNAGAGFWLHGDRVGGTLFLFDNLYDALGVDRLAAWGKLQGVRGDRLPVVCGAGSIVFYPDEPNVVPIQAIIDAVVDRRLRGPTELTANELSTLLCGEPEPKKVLAAQQRLQEVGITWPGSPEIPEKPT